MPTEKVIHGAPRTEIVTEDRHAQYEFYRWLTLLVGRIPRMETYTLDADPVTVAANSTSEQTFNVPGIQGGEIMTCSKPSYTSGLGIVNVRASAKDTVAITFMNITGAPIDPPQEAYVLMGTRV